MKRYYSKEEIDIANSYCLADLLRRNGYTLVPESGGQYHLREHDSLKISGTDGKWYWFSRQQGGKNIDFFMTYEDLDFTKAIEKILSTVGYAQAREDKDKDRRTENQMQAKSEEREPNRDADFKLPERNETNRRAYAYLTKTRGLDPKLVISLLNSGHVYEAKNTHNVVFVGTDYNGKAVSAFERGTGEKKFTRDSCGSNKHFRFRIVSTGAEKVNVFEAEIDMLSYICMYGLKNENYIALGGVSTPALEAFLDHEKHIRSINLCLDNDPAGDIKRRSADYERSRMNCRKKLHIQLQKSKNWKRRKSCRQKLRGRRQIAT